MNIDVEENKFLKHETYSKHKMIIICFTTVDFLNFLIQIFFEKNFKIFGFRFQKITFL